MNLTCSPMLLFTAVFGWNSALKSRDFIRIFLPILSVKSVPVAQPLMRVMFAAADPMFAKAKVVSIAFRSFIRLLGPTPQNPPVLGGPIVYSGVTPLLTVFVITVLALGFLGKEAPLFFLKLYLRGILILFV